MVAEQNPLRFVQTLDTKTATCTSASGSYLGMPLTLSYLRDFNVVDALQPLGDWDNPSTRVNRERQIMRGQCRSAGVSPARALPPPELGL
jgi:hypothetical protein